MASDTGTADGTAEAVGALAEAIAPMRPVATPEMEAHRTEAAAVLNTQVYRFPWRKEGAICNITYEPLKGSEGTPAWYIDNRSDVFLNPLAIHDDPAEVERLVKAIATGGIREIPDVWMGMLAHEYAHSRWSTWDYEEGTTVPVAQVMELFEEIRIEKRAADWRGADAVRYLRASFRWILESFTKGGGISSNPFSLANAWALTYGRYLASIASEVEVSPVDSAIRTALTDEVVDLLQEILEEAVQCHSVDRLKELAIEWLETIEPGGSENPPPTMVLVMHSPSSGSGEGGEKGDDEGDGSSDGEGKPQPKPEEGSSEAAEILAAALSQVAEDIEANGATPSAPQSEDMSDPSEEAGNVFGGHGWGKSNRKQGWHTREPDPQLRLDAIRIARTLEAISLPSITLTHVASQVPPGRLRSREMIRQAAERDQGMMSTATPWRSSKRKRAHTKPVIVGCMTDTSGSMSWAENFVADFAWTMATAGSRVGARTAAVTFGNDAERVTRPGEIPQLVRVRAANGGSEAFDQGAAAIEGVLHLGVNSNAAKVVFIVSDGQLVRDGEKDRAARWIERWTQAGTLVVWLGAYPHCWAEIGRKASRPGKAINLDYGRDTESLMREMEHTVLRAARGII